MAVLGVALGLFIPLAVVGGVVAVVVYVVRGGRSAEGGGFTMRTLLRGYLRFAYLISLVVFLVGVAGIVTAGFGAAFGSGFSYTSQNPPCPVVSGTPSSAPKPIPCDLPKDTRQADDLIRGVSLVLAGLVLGGGHWAGLRALEPGQERDQSALARGEALIATTGFGLVTIIAIPWAAYLVLHYAVLGTGNQGGGPDPPGGALAVALAFTPAWAYYLSKFVGLVRRAHPAGG